MVAFHLVDPRRFIPPVFAHRWLYRLAPGEFWLEERSEGGQTLYRVEWPWKQPARRHEVVSRKGNGVVKLR